MPWRSYAERDAAVQAVKDAAAEGRLGVRWMFAEDLSPQCALGHAAVAIGYVPQALEGRFDYVSVDRAIGLSTKESRRITEANDDHGPEAAIAAMLAVPVGGEPPE